MNKVKNRKLCYNCEGSVHIHATKCSYCGTDLTQDPNGIAPAAYEAPMRAQSQPIAQASARHEIPEPPYADYRTDYREPRHVEPAMAMPERPMAAPHLQERVARERDSESDPVKSILFSIMLLLPGAFFLLFGMLLLLFSSDGVLTLRWNANYWILYASLAAPLLYFGYRSLGRNEPAQVSVKERIQR